MWIWLRLQYQVKSSSISGKGWSGRMEFGVHSRLRAFWHCTYAFGARPILVDVYYLFCRAKSSSHMVTGADFYCIY
jgi:hypothetical protein